MGLQNASVNEGGTFAAPTGGSAKTYTPSPTPVKGGVQVADFSVADVKTRPTISARTSVQPSVDTKTGVWSDGKREIVVTRPKVLASGVQKFPNIRILLKDHPDMSQAEIDALWHMVAVVATHADFASFRRTGSIA